MVGKRRWVAAGASASLAAFALGATLGLLALPQSPTQRQALEQWSAEKGFRSDSVLHVVPLLSARNADLVHNPTYRSSLMKQVQEVADWFNQGADGTRTIFSAVEDGAPQVLIPEYPNSESVDQRQANWRGGKRPPRGEEPLHDCQPLLDSADSTADDLGEDRVVVFVVDEHWQCPFVGIAGFRDNWVVVNGWDTSQNRLNQLTLIHELGHVLGLPHARRYDCPSNTGPSEKPRLLSTCDIHEYGDVSDPMGASFSEKWMGFNAFNRYLLGWNAEPRIIAKAGARRVRIPLATASGPAYVEIPGGFMLSYRAPSGEPHDPDAHLGWGVQDESLAGVYLHRKASDKQDASTYPVLVPFRSTSPAGRVGDHFISPGSNVAFRITDVTPGSHATVEVRIGTNKQPVRDQWGPSIDLVELRELHGNFLLAQWHPVDPSGIQQMYAVLDGRRVATNKSGALVVMYAEDPQPLYFVAVDNEGNRSVTDVYTVPGAGGS